MFSRKGKILIYKMTNYTGFPESLLTLFPPIGLETTVMQILADSTDFGSENEVFHQFEALL